MLMLHMNDAQTGLQHTHLPYHASYRCHIGCIQKTLHLSRLIQLDWIVMAVLLRVQAVFGAYILYSLCIYIVA